MSYRKQLGGSLKVTTQKQSRYTKPLNLADFAQAAYTHKSMPGYFIDSELSGPDRTIYHDGKHAIVTFKGTDNWRDIQVDAAMGAGFKDDTNRFKNSLDVTNRAIKKYGKSNVFVTGHSLGGSQAIYVHQQTGVQGSAIAPFIDPQDVSRRDKQGVPFVNSNFNIHAVVGDAVALGTYVHLLDRPNVHLYTPKSKYESIAASASTGSSNPISFANPFVKLGVAGAQVLAGTKSSIGLHAIGNFTSNSNYGDKVRERDVRLPSAYLKTGPPEQEFRVSHETSTPHIPEVAGMGTFLPNPTPKTPINYWSVQ